MIFDHDYLVLVPCQVQMYTFSDISEHLSFEPYRTIKKTDWAIGSSPDGTQKKGDVLQSASGRIKKSGD